MFPQTIHVKPEVEVSLPCSHYLCSCSATRIPCNDPDQKTRAAGGRKRTWGMTARTHLRKQSASPSSVFTTHPRADTIWGQEPEQAMTAASAGTTTQEAHLEITASESTLLPDKPAQGAEPMKVQGCHFKIPITSATMKSSCPRLYHLAVHSYPQVTFPLLLA